MVGEPVVFDIAVDNHSTTAVEANSWIMPGEIHIDIARDGEPFHRIHLRNNHFISCGTPLYSLLHPGEKRTMQFQVVLDHIGERTQLAFASKGFYTIRASYPLQITSTYEFFPSNSVRIFIREPQGDDLFVLGAIKKLAGFGFLVGDQVTKDDIPSVLEMAKLLRLYPTTCYGPPLRCSLLKFYRSFKSALRTDDREMVRQLVGEPDDRFFPDDPRMESRVRVNFVKTTPVSQILASLTAKSGVPLSGSPYIMHDQTRVSMFDETRPLRDQLVDVTTLTFATCVRRGAGYYFYSETHDGLTTLLRKIAKYSLDNEKVDSSKWRLELEELLGPVEVFFPEDKRLDVDVVADAPNRVPLDQIIAGYAQQSGVPLQSSPFFRRCFQGGGKQSFRLREEMAFVARTFQARWEPRGTGYILAAGADADAEIIPPAPK